MRQVGMITGQVEGAIPNGSRVFKTGSEPGDAHRDGASATVLSSTGEEGGFLGYFVEWDDMPGIPVFVTSARVRLDKP